MDLGFTVEDVFDDGLSLDVRCLIIEEHILNLDGALPQKELFYRIVRYYSNKPQSKEEKDELILTLVNSLEPKLLRSEKLEHFLHNANLSTEAKILIHHYRTNSLRREQREVIKPHFSSMDSPTTFTSRLLAVYLYWCNKRLRDRPDLAERIIQVHHAFVNLPDDDPCFDPEDRASFIKSLSKVSGLCD
jgi:hypothetical protein